MRSVAKSMGRALSPAQLRRMQAAEARRAELAAEAEPMVIGGRVLTRSQRERLAEAEKLAGGGQAERRKAASLVRQVEAELAAARAEGEVEAGIADTLERARARGEAFDVEVVDVGEWRRNDDGGLARRDGLPILDVKTHRRASRTDGLVSLYRAGSITDEEKRLADAFRALVEAARPPLKAGDLEPSRGGVVDRERSMAAAIARGFAAVRLSMVAHAVGDGRAYAVLDAVAGHGQTIRSLGSGGDLNALNKSRLKAGLAGLKAAMADPKWKELANQER